MGPWHSWHLAALLLGGILAGDSGWDDGVGGGAINFVGLLLLLLLTFLILSMLSDKTCNFKLHFSSVSLAVDVITRNQGCQEDPRVGRRQPRVW